LGRTNRADVIITSADVVRPDFSETDMPASVHYDPKLNKRRVLSHQDFTVYSVNGFAVRNVAQPPHLRTRITQLQTSCPMKRPARRLL
jgi:hypothetical protein